MNETDAVRLIDGAIPRHAGTWADFGAGDGTFTRALAEILGRKAKVYAVDRDPRAMAAVERWAAKSAANVIPVVADFTRPFELPGLDGALEGMLFANALHFVRDADVVVARLAEWLRPGGRVVIVEYDRRPASLWVPYPVPAARLPALAESAGLATPVIVATQPSAYGGDLYVATADRLATSPRPSPVFRHSA